ncbi:sensor histidine kinase [Pedobacter sp. GR22-10]|uniref:sensor histidine kinase n=1 Tax=Pedobacter sp. GR22-10 TaxID=2994472 RepID=UPI002245A116|nr:sensor histidine kinase [Pedobacter sp. GR22-10]MCX2431131.1 histidine kinase [Pedobacter sp. GR22-10]
MILLINLVFLMLILRLSFDKKVMDFLLNGKWPGVITVQHLLFWMAFIGISSYIYVSFFNLAEAALAMLFMLSINIPVYLLCFKKLVPEFYQKARYGEYVRYTAALFVISSLMRILVEPELFRAFKSADSKYLFMVYLMQAVIILVPSVQGISKYKLIAERELSALSLRKKEADMELVKSKINPHFLFNTLNNIYSHSYATDGSSADLIKQLSLLMQYTTYEMEKKTIPIERELQMIAALSKLYQLKSNRKLNLVMNFESSELTAIVEIPPTIYLTLFENAVKYSAMGRDENAQITASLLFKEAEVEFNLFNTISEKKITDNASSYRGAGLKVLKMMLDREYGEKYEMKTDQNDTSYSSKLIIRI